MGLFHNKYCTGYWNTLKMALELKNSVLFWMEHDNSNMITKILFKNQAFSVDLQEDPLTAARLERVQYHLEKSCSSGYECFKKKIKGLPLYKPRSKYMISCFLQVIFPGIYQDHTSLVILLHISLIFIYSD